MLTCLLLCDLEAIIRAPLRVEYNTACSYKLCLYDYKELCGRYSRDLQITVQNTNHNRIYIGITKRTLLNGMSDGILSGGTLSDNSMISRFMNGDIW